MHSDDIKQFLEAGGKVIVGKYKKPRKEEKTFRNNKFSVYNMGHQKSVMTGFCSSMRRV